MTQTEKKLEELKELSSKLESVKIDTKQMTEKEEKQVREILQNIKKYSGNPVALKNYLIHTRNELRSTNR